MANEQVRLPDLGEGLTEATIVRWLVDVGDAVTADQIVAEVETAKATVELPTPHAGTVAALHAAEGEEVAVGTAVLTLDSAAAPSSEAPPAADDAETAEHGDEGDDGSDVLVGYGTGRGSRRRRRGRSHRTPPSQPARPRAKPPVRKLAKDLGVDLEALTGTGPDGHITRDDVRGAARPPAEAAPRRVPSPVGDRREAVTGVRARIADHLSVAWREIPAASCWVECDASAMLAVRDELAAAHPDVKLTPLPLILRSCVVALGQVPQLNASFDAERREIVHHGRVDLGVATQTGRGLLVPVVRDAGGRSVLDLASEVERLAGEARSGELAPAELVGSTFTVSNVGAFGIDGGGPIINHPEAGILGVGRIARRPWVVDDAVVIRPVVQLMLSFDHRVCDGAEAAGFLRRVADLVERPTLLLAH
jgi:pyruvate dehydrogenase E2 component (dihydrolipoamide acetyltransferase)